MRWDIHAHWLPGVDDGAKDAYMSALMLRNARDMGLYGVCATPHVYAQADLARVAKRFERIKAPAEGTGLRVLLGAEVNYRAIPDIQKGNLLDYCVAGTNFILLEFSDTMPLARWDVLVCEWVSAGFVPIIAHPERYVYIQRNIQMAKEMVQYGCELQTSACHLNEGRLSAARRTALKLLEDGYTSYIASDAHTPEDYLVYQKVCKSYHDVWPREGRLEAELTRMALGMPSRRRRNKNPQR